MAGLHINDVTGTADGGFACDNGNTCIGSAELYINGQKVGTMMNSTPIGLLSLVPIQHLSNRLALSFTMP